MKRYFPEPSGEDAADVRNPFSSNPATESVPDELQIDFLDQLYHFSAWVCYAAIIPEPNCARLCMSASIRFHLPLSQVVQELGEKAHPVQLDLSTIWAISHKIWTKRFRHFLAILMKLYFFVIEYIIRRFLYRRKHVKHL